MGNEARYAVLQHKQEDVQQEDDSYYRDEHVEHMPCLAGVAHLQEDAKDVDRQQRDERHLNGL